MVCRIEDWGSGGVFITMRLEEGCKIYCHCGKLNCYYLKRCHIFLSPDYFSHLFDLIESMPQQ